MLDLLDEFRALLQALEAEGAPFAVCGGLAVAIHAHPRATLDVDLLVPPEALEAVRAVARRLGYGFVTPALREVWETRERVTWAHGKIPVTARLVRMSQLRRLCLELGRAKPAAERDHSSQPASSGGSRRGGGASGRG